MDRLCILCLKDFSEKPKLLQNINRCCAGKICIICYQTHLRSRSIISLRCVYCGTIYVQLYVKFSNIVAHKYLYTITIIKLFKPYKSYYDSDIIIRKRWRKSTLNNVEDQPACMRLCANIGMVLHMEWYVDNKICRNNILPCKLVFNKSFDLYYISFICDYY